MNKELTDKNIEYQDQLHQMSVFLYNNFYKSEEEEATFLEERESINDLMAKSEKIFQYFGSFPEAKKAIKFFHIFNPAATKAILDEI